MTIQNIAITSTTNFGITRKQALTDLFDKNNNDKSNNDLLSPEQKNILQDDFNAKIAEQANNIKSNFQTAKDIDLTRAYYEQQQKLVDIYMQAGVDNNSSNNSHISTTKALAETYASLYQLHQTIREGAQSLPSYPDEIQSQARRQTNIYNNYMMPTTNSTIHLHA